MKKVFTKLTKWGRTVKALADVLALGGVIFLARCARNAVAHEDPNLPILLLAMLFVWVLLCVLFLRNQNRI